MKIVAFGAHTAHLIWAVLAAGTAFLASGLVFSLHAAVAAPAALLLITSWLLAYVHTPDGCARCARLATRPARRWYHQLAREDGYAKAVANVSMALTACILVTILFNQPTAFLVTMTAALTLNAVDLRLTLVQRASESGEQNQSAPSPA